MDDVRELIDLDEYLRHYNYNNLQEKYFMESKFLPIKQIITAQKSVETAFYRYTYFPKMLNILAMNYNIISSLSWPPESLKASKCGFLRDIFNPEQCYTHENINDAIWLSCWIGTYWYHENDEK
jgi:hypothetical protein